MVSIIVAKMQTVKPDPSIVLRVAVVQNCATPDAQANIAGLLAQVQDAARQGARFIALPEACEFLHPDNAEFGRHARPVPEHSAAIALRAAAKQAGAWLL